MWRWIQNTIQTLLRASSANKTESAEGRLLTEVYFDNLIVVNKTPSDDAVGAKQFIEVVYKDVPRWAMFKCPCACGNTISLPLQRPHSPVWKVTISGAGRPTLFPSVWQNKGCMSHFWIEDGRVSWCGDSGIAPSIARPDLYSRQRNQ
jgi:hypothetical protein